MKSSWRGRYFKPRLLRQNHLEGSCWLLGPLLGKQLEEKPPNVLIEGVGESRQRLDVRFDPSTIAWIHRVVARKKEAARKAGLPEPTLTWVLEKLVLDGIKVDEDQEKQRSKELEELEKLRGSKMEQPRRPST